MRIPAIATLILVLHAAASAESRFDVPILKDATAVLRVNDARWIDRQVTVIAGASGQDPKSAREQVARSLFCSSSLAGIDVGRPALLAWRPGKSPLVAVIPVGNRRLFVDNFGAMPAGEPPLVRIGDREGTVVLTQNREGGREEYRLLVSDNTAYLARTADECHLLAAKPIPQAIDDAVASFTAWGPFTNRLPMGVALELPAPLRMWPLEGTAAAAVAQQVETAVVSQLASWSWSIHPLPSGAMVSATAQATADSQLADWLGSQANQANRLLPVIKGPNTVALVYGQLAWQGQCEAFGQALTGTVKALAQERWTPQAEAAWHSLWSVFDRTGAFALSHDLGADRSEGGALVAEQTQAQVLATNIAALAPVLSGRTAEPATVGTLAGSRLARAGAPDELIVPAERHIVVVKAAGDEAIAGASEIVQRLGAINAPTGTVGVVAASIDLTRWERITAKEPVEPEVQLPQVGIDIAVKVGHDQITIDSALPITDIVQLLTKTSGK